MYHYANSRLSKNPRMQLHLQTDSYRCERLVEMAVEKANGCFLWIHIAVWDLLNALKELNSLHDLQSRLDGMASDLDGLFRQHLTNLGPVNRQLTKAILELTMDRQTSVYTAAFATEYYEAPWGINQHTADSVRLFEVKLQEMQSICTTQCAGLLDVVGCEPSSPLLPVERSLKDAKVDHGKYPRFDTSADTRFVRIARRFQGRRLSFKGRSAYEFLLKEGVARDIFGFLETSEDVSYHRKCLALWGDLAFWLHFLPWHLETIDGVGFWNNGEYTRELDHLWTLINGTNHQYNNAPSTGEALIAASRHLPRVLNFIYRICGTHINTQAEEKGLKHVVSELQSLLDDINRHNGVEQNPPSMSKTLFSTEGAPLAPPSPEAELTQLDVQKHDRADVLPAQANAVKFSHQRHLLADNASHTNLDPTNSARGKETMVTPPSPMPKPAISSTAKDFAKTQELFLRNFAILESFVKHWILNFIQTMSAPLIALETDILSFLGPSIVPLMPRKVRLLWLCVSNSLAPLSSAKSRARLQLESTGPRLRVHKSSARRMLTS